MAPPSQVVDGVPPQTDAVLDAARKGALDAHRLADQLRAIPTFDRNPTSTAWSRRWLVGSSVLVLLAVALIAAASAMNRSEPSAASIPEGSTDSTVVSVTTTSTTTPDPPASTIPPAAPVVVDDIASFDPLADRAENDRRLPNLIDGDASTEWRTETYFDPLTLIKDGVGISLATSGTPASLDLLNLSAGTAFSIRWSPTLSDDPAAWEVLATGRSLGGPLTIQVAPRTDGYWLIWFTELSPTGEGDFRTSLGEVRFRP